MYLWLIAPIAARTGWVCLVVIEKWTPARMQVLTTAWLSNAESIPASSRRALSTVGS
jgi:hypothetical protein